MKKLIIALVMLTPCLVQAQSGLLEKIKNRAKAKAEQRIVNRADKEIDKTLDDIEGKNQPAKETGNSTASNQKQNAPVQDATPTITAYSKYDFVPGEKIVYADDFSQDEIGELPLGWNTGGKAELVTLDAYPGRWLKLYQNAMYLTSNKDTFSRNFTVEFDMILQLKQVSGYSYPQLSVGMLASSTLEPNSNEILDRHKQFQAAHVQIRPSEGGNTNTYLETALDGKKYFLSETQNTATLEKYYHKITHIAMQVQGPRIRVWINGEKKFDLPMAMPTSYIFNQLFFQLHQSSLKDDQIGIFIGNLKVATGKPDTRHKLVEEGKFSTTGILFNVNSAEIKPESGGVLKEIADVLKKFPEVRVMIVGHTDSDGQDAANLTLSQKRAAAVKESLVKEYGIEDGRIQTDGKGEKEPVGDNKTKEGKAQNRRVEFIKVN